MKPADEGSVIRFQATTLIQDVGIRLQVPQMTIATAQTIFHRFFAKEPLADHDPMDIAQTCLFVAGKSQETPRRLRDVINTVYRYRNPDLPPLEVADPFWQMKEHLIESERLVLRVIAFDVDVVPPHAYAVHFLRDLRASNDLANCTLSILNDSCRIPLCLHYEPHVIACGAMYLATELLSVRPGDGDDEWFPNYGAHRAEVEDICHQLLGMYESVRMPANPADADSAQPTGRDNEPFSTPDLNNDIWERRMSR
ncbi:Cyclin-like domain-containing protein [Plasmodiophora brassicae]|uniref:Cyclin-like domain-containing protein n=1 Tax=Plasmodiophora brassicae TaxID=37360 RepID=A0A0G4IYJ5_PLABS|nr:hypothetical protein PBRA_001492 [Plasmodiophora brassicae]SPQ94059.1 unnamed protein product [Plasmodiophora brassicae]